MVWKQGKRTSPGVYAFRGAKEEELRDAIFIFGRFRGVLIPSEYTVKGNSITLTIPEPSLGGGTVELWAHSNPGALNVKG